jgi:tetratricopeptide (TPR) repeat protein
MACARIIKRLILMSFLLLASLFPVSSLALGQSFEAGFKAFKSGNYKKASVYLKRSLQKTSDPFDLAFTYKLLGVCQYKTGQKNSAFQSFKKALQYDPQIEISKSEAQGDPGIKRMFSSARLSKRQVNPSPRRRGRRSRNISRRSSVNQSSPADQILLFAPFGVGQFQQKKNLLGGLFAAGQAGALVSAIMFDAEFKDNDKSTKDTAAEYDGGGNSISKEEFEAYLDEAEKYGNDRQDYLNYSLFAFVGLYGASVLEAFLNPPKTFKPRKRPSQRRRFGDIEPSTTHQELEEVYIADQRVEKGPKFAFYSNFNMKKPKAMLGLDFHF